MGALQFYFMSWTGQHVVKKLREEIFQQIHRLSLNYYAEHEAGQVMSRVTNDMDTISQAFGFALVSVTSGVLLIVWVAFNMLRLSVPYALVTLAVVPVMWLVTNWFSGQARHGVPPHARRRSAESTPTCRRASRACARCRRSAARTRTSRLPELQRGEP